jgi:beta-lactamase superfamily II metal-dependent hydrolase
MSDHEDNYGVDVHQINVGQGDSAIYILFKKGFPNRQIISTVLVDGGERQSEKRDVLDDGNIRRTINHINKVYNLKKNNLLRFDSIVVTHWDSDHICGVAWLIQADLAAGKVEKPKRTQCTFLKYEPITKVPKTIIYFPYWKPEDSASKLKRLKGAETWDKVFAKQKDKQQQETDIMEWYLHRDKAEADIVQNVNRVRHTPETMLGVDFFLNNPSPVANNHQNVTSLEALLDQEKNVNKNRPGLLCICTDRIRLGSAVNLQSGEEEEEEEEEESDSDSGVDSNSDSWKPTMTRLRTTNDNRVSIVTLVVWRVSKQISYYAAGDLDDPFEAKIVEWSQAGPNQFKVPVIKASHHGAPGSFPQNMIATWEPHSIIFSCGDKHHHPGTFTLLGLPYQTFFFSGEKTQLIIPHRLGNHILDHRRIIVCTR